MRGFVTALCLGATLLVPAWAQTASSPPWNCTGTYKGAQLQPSNPSYQDALALFLTLNDRGVVSDCVAMSKSDGLLKGQRGAAVFHTDKGLFDALFFPTRQQVQEIRIAEQQNGGSYTHTLSTPLTHFTRTWSNHFPMYYVKYENVLLMIFKDEDLARVLRDALTP